MRALASLAGAAMLVVAVAAACSSAAPRYPACARDDQCTAGSKHDYCVAARCVHCRTSIDCADREMCRGGECKPDPNAPPPPVLDAGDDADDDAATDEDSAAAGADDSTEDDHAPPESPRHVLPPGVRRFFHP
ncbi:MAG TPA: hypothetical protein VGH28_05200 [Polyangiaceae bacterium]|jgi:hypothetical protein